MAKDTNPLGPPSKPSTPRLPKIPTQKSLDPQPWQPPNTGSGGRGSLLPPNSRGKKR
jgi:hypothetical protein